MNKSSDLQDLHVAYLIGMKRSLNEHVKSIRQPFKAEKIEVKASLDQIECDLDKWLLTDRFK